MMSIIDFKEIKRRKEKNTNIDRLFLQKLRQPLEELFSSKLREYYFFIIKTSIDNNTNTKNQMIKRLKVLDKQYFSHSGSWDNKVQLLKYFGMLTNEYNLRIVDFITSNLEVLLEKNMKEELKEMLERIINNDEGNVKELAEECILKINQENDNKLSIGGRIPSYGDITNSSISIGGCIYASSQQA